MLAGVGALLIAKNPRIQILLAEVAEGIALRQAQQREAQQQAALPAKRPIIEIPVFKPFQFEYSVTPSPAYTPPLDEPLARLLDHPAVILILGHRGSGKTALAFRLQELLRDVAVPYAVGLPGKASGLLPDWYGLAQDFDSVPTNAVIYVPESYRLFHARDTQSAQGRAVADLVNLSRHRKHTLIFDVQNAVQLDRNIVSEVDLVLVKEPGPFQQGFERTRLQGIMDSARAAFAGAGKGRKKRAVWVVAPGADIKGQLMENLLPTFWSESLSRVFGGAGVGLGNVLPLSTNDGGGSGSARPRRGKRTSTDIRREKAKQMRASGYSYGEIADTLETRPETPCREEGFGQGGRREQSEGPNLPEPRGPGIGGGVAHASGQGAAGPGTGGGFSRRAGFGGHQGQVGHRGGQVQLEPGFDAAEVAGLADSQLDQPCQPVLHHHAALPILSKTLAVLPGAGLLQ